MPTTVDSTAEPIIEKRIPNRYSLVVLAAKRARQIKEGAPPLIDTDNPNALSVALDEITAGKIDYIEAPEIPDDEAPRREPVKLAPIEPTPMDLLNDSLAMAELDASSTDDTGLVGDDEEETVIIDGLFDSEPEADNEDSASQEED